MVRFFLKYTFCCLGLLLFTGCKPGTRGHHITLELKNSTPTDTVFFRNLRYDSRKDLDTILPVKNNKYLIQGENHLPEGMYEVNVKNRVSLEFFISDTMKQNFTATADIRNPVATVVFIGSEENQAFADYKRFMEEAIKRHPYPLPPSGINRKLETIAGRFPGTMLEMYIHTVMEPVPPAPPVPLVLPNQEQVVQDYQYNYYVRHFFDRIDFSDKRVMEMPVLKHKAGIYFSRVLIPDPDTLISGVVNFLQKTASNDELFTASVRELYGLFRELPVPGGNDISSYIAEKYILSDPERWNDPHFVDKTAERVRKSKLNPPGSKTAALKLRAPDGRMIDLYKVDAPMTVLYFFNPGCEACNPVTRELNDLFRQYKNKGFVVFAVCLEADRELWLDYIRKENLHWINVYDRDRSEGIEEKYDLHAIPMIYLLDRDKKVIVKDVSLELLRKYL